MSTPAAEARLRRSRCAHVLAGLQLFALAALPAVDAVATPVRPASALVLRLVPLDAPARGAGADGSAWVDFGSVAAHPRNGRREPIVVRQRIAVRLDGARGGVPTARVSVALKSETPGCVVRVDGATVSMLPRLVDPMHRIGTSVVHQVEVTIPASVPAGAFLSDLHWLAESD